MLRIQLLTGLLQVKLKNTVSFVLASRNHEVGCFCGGYHANSGSYV